MHGVYNTRKKVVRNLLKVSKGSTLPKKLFLSLLFIYVMCKKIYGYTQNHT